MTTMIIDDIKLKTNSKKPNNCYMYKKKNKHETNDHDIFRN